MLRNVNNNNNSNSPQDRLEFFEAFRMNIELAHLIILSLEKANLAPDRRERFANTLESILLENKSSFPPRSVGNDDDDLIFNNTAEQL